MSLKKPILIRTGQLLFYPYQMPVYDPVPMKTKRRHPVKLKNQPKKLPELIIPSAGRDFFYQPLFVLLRI
jgi:hypothetical protein